MSNLNGTAERLNLNLQQRVRSLIFDSGFSKEMWAYVLSFVIDLYDKTPKQILQGKSPYSLFHNRPVSIKYLRRFGCECYVLKPNRLDKFEETTFTAYLVGCKDDSYNIDPVIGKVWRSKNVDFNENKTYRDVYCKDQNMLKTVFDTTKTKGVEKGSDRLNEFPNDDDKNEINQIDKTPCVLIADLGKLNTIWYNYFRDESEAFI